MLAGTTTMPHYSVRSYIYIMRKRSNLLTLSSTNRLVRWKRATYESLIIFLGQGISKMSSSSSSLFLSQSSLAGSCSPHTVHCRVIFVHLYCLLADVFDDDALVFVTAFYFAFAWRNWILYFIFLFVLIFFRSWLILWEECDALLSFKLQLVLSYLSNVFR